MKWTGWAAQPYYENDGGSLLLVYSSTGEVRAASARTRSQFTPHHFTTSPSPSPCPRHPPAPALCQYLSASRNWLLPSQWPLCTHTCAPAPRRWRWAGRAESYRALSTRETRWVTPCACMCMMYVYLAAHPSPPLAIAQRLSLRQSLHCRACSPSYARRAMWPRPVLESAEPATPTPEGCGTSHTSRTRPLHVTPPRCCARRQPSPRAPSSSSATRRSSRRAGAPVQG